MTMLDCGHPEECQYHCDECDEYRCGWCDEEARATAMQQTIHLLTKHIEDHAFVVHGGTLNITTPDAVGLVTQYGGTLNLHGDYATHIGTVVEKEEEGKE